MLGAIPLLAMICCSAAQVPYLGGCPSVTTQPNFDASKYLGKWYEAERYFAIFQFGGKCVTANYALNDNGTISVINKQISIISGHESQIVGFAEQKDSQDPAKLTVKFPSVPIQAGAPYWILGTDYDNYAVVWSCSDFGLFDTRNLWILTREQNPPVSILETAYKVLDKNGISRAFLTRTDQKNCQSDST